MAARARVDVELIVRVVAAVLCVLALFSLRWDSSLDHFDFQVWRAAEAIIDGGADPYDPDVLNLELENWVEHH